MLFNSLKFGSPLGFSVASAVNVISNGTFASDTVWVKEDGWTIAGGVGVGTAVTGAIYQENVLTVSVSYEITYTVTRSAGSVKANAGGTQGTARSTSGTFTETLVTDDTYFEIVATGFTGTIDDVTVVAV